MDKTAAASRMQSGTRLLLYVATHEWRNLSVVVVCIIGIGFLQIPAPLITMHLIDGVNKRHSSAGFVTIAVLGLLVVFFVGMLVRVVQSAMLEKLRNRIVLPIQRRLCRHILRLPLSYYRVHPHGYLMARLREDPMQMHTLLTESMISIIGDSVTLVAGCAFLLHVNWRMALATVSILPVLISLYVAVRRGLEADCRMAQERSAVMNQTLATAFAQVYTVKVFGIELPMARTTAHATNEAVRQRLVIWRKRLLYQSVISSITGIVPIGVLWYGITEISRGTLTIGELIAFSSFLGQLYRPAESIVISLLSIQNSTAAADRVADLLAVAHEESLQPCDAKCPHAPLSEAAPDATVCFDHVTFRYSAAAPPILDNVSVRFQAGTVNLVSGPSGEGKTTLLNLIPRFYHQETGAITIGGTDIRSIPLDILRKRISIVSQETALFPGSILDNIKIGSSRRVLEDVVAAARIACCHDFISEFPDGYETSIGENGQGLSAGQRQRLMIARSVLRNPDVLILDEGTGMVDLAIEARIIRNLRTWLHKQVVIIVSHRESLQACADRAYVFKNARLTESRLQTRTADGVSDFSGPQKCPVRTGSLNRMQNRGL